MVDDDSEIDDVGGSAKPAAAYARVALNHLTKKVNNLKLFSSLLSNMIKECLRLAEIFFIVGGTPTPLFLG
jgi:hypothetical protein